MNNELAIYGGPMSIQDDPGDIFKWPIITEEDELAVLNMLKHGKMSGIDETLKFEKEFAKWHNVKYALACNNGTASLHSAMYGVGVGVGDEVICQSLTIWASALPAFSLGASIVFADLDKQTMTLDPEDIERKITDKTKAIIVVHYMGHPANMDAIMSISKKHNIKVIEDVSHAHGALYNGKIVGTIGHVGAMSVMSEKSLAIGEGGFLITDDKNIWDRAVAFGHYERTGIYASTSTSFIGEDKYIQNPELNRFGGFPLGGYKYRINQLSSALGRVQLKHYRKRMEEIQKAMNYFWDQLEGVPGIRSHRPPKDSGNTKGGWYSPKGLYIPEELGELNIDKFCEALRAEGVLTKPGLNVLMHEHPVINEADIYGHGIPTFVANSGGKNKINKGSLPVSEILPNLAFDVPWFKHYRPKIIDQYVNAFRKVAENADKLE